MRKRAPLIFLAFLLSACAADPFAPPRISSALLNRARLDNVTPQELSAGRSLFATRCLECHTLPSVAKYSRDQWPGLVARMSGRANLSAAERALVVAYLRAAAPSDEPAKRETIWSTTTRE